MKTEQTTIVYTQWDRWTSYDVIKHHMITTDVKKNKKKPLVVFYIILTVFMVFLSQCIS